MSQQINLFNPIFRQQKKYFSSVTMAQALGVIAVACLLLAGDAMYRARKLQAQAAASDALLQARQQKLADYKVQYAPRVKSATLPDEIAAAQMELTMLTNAAATLKRGGFGDTRGFSEYFRALARQSVNGLWLTEVTIGAGGDQIGVRGRTLEADLVPAYMRRLSAEPIMQGKAFASLEIERPNAQAVAGESAGAGTPAPAMAGGARYLEFSLQSAGAAGQGGAVAK